jgi:hypothetical protein
MASTDRLERARGYWGSKLAGRPMPARSDLDPVEIPDLLPFIVLTDITHHPFEMRYRLVGTGVVARCSYDYTGLRFTQLPNKGPGSRIWELRATAVSERRPVYEDQVPYVGPSRYVRQVREVHLPLSEDGRHVNMIFSVFHFDETDPPVTSGKLVCGLATVLG